MTGPENLWRMRNTGCCVYATVESGVPMIGRGGVVYNA